MLVSVHSDPEDSGYRAQMCWLVQARPSLRWPKSFAIATKSHALAQINFGTPIFKVFVRVCVWFVLWALQFNLWCRAHYKILQNHSAKVLKTIYPKTHQIEFVFLYVYFFSLTLELDSCYFLRKPNLHFNSLPASGEFSSLLIAFAGSKLFDTLIMDLKLVNFEKR